MMVRLGEARAMAELSRISRFHYNVEMSCCSPGGSQGIKEVRQLDFQCTHPPVTEAGIVRLNETRERTHRHAKGEKGNTHAAVVQERKGKAVYCFTYV